MQPCHDTIIGLRRRGLTDACVSWLHKTLLHALHGVCSPALVLVQQCKRGVSNGKYGFALELREVLHTYGASFKDEIYVSPSVRAV